MYSFGIGWACQAPDKTCFLMPYTVWHERWRKCFFSQARWSCGNTARFVWLTSEVKVTRLGERRHLICLWRLLKTCPGVLMRMSFEHFEDEACGGCDTVGGEVLLLFHPVLELRVRGSHWGGTEGIYGLWMRPIVMLMRSDASDDPQSGIILYESAPRLRRIHTRRQSLRITQLHIKINVRELWAVSALTVRSLYK